MPKKEGTRLIREIEGEALRYLVESHSRPQSPYMVDLSEHKGNGACSCKDFQTRRWPAIRDGHPTFTRATSCVHIITARRHWMKTTLTECARIVKDQEKPKRYHNAK